MPQKFYRKPAVIEFSGFGYTEFHEGMKDGRIPLSDGYLGPRSPFWTEETVCKMQANLLAEAPKKTRGNPVKRRAQEAA
jgi:hypothetical protein